MASIKDALEESINDNLAVVKYILYAVPVFFSYTFFNKGNMEAFFMLGSITTLMLATVLIEIIYNVRTSQNRVLPDFNIFTFCGTSLKTIFALGPLLGLGLWGGNMLCNIQIPIAIPNINVQLIYSIIVWLIIGSIILTALILFAKTKKIKDAYNLKLIANTCIDFLLAMLFYIPQLIILNGLAIGCIAYVFAIFLTLDNPIFIFICSLAFVINIAITGNYLAQVDYDVVPRENNN